MNKPLAFLSLSSSIVEFGPEFTTPCPQVCCLQQHQAHDGDMSDSQEMTANWAPKFDASCLFLGPKRWAEMTELPRKMRLFVHNGCLSARILINWVCWLLCHGVCGPKCSSTGAILKTRVDQGWSWNFQAIWQSGPASKRNRKWFHETMVYQMCHWVYPCYTRFCGSNGRPCGQCPWFTVEIHIFPRWIPVSSAHPPIPGGSSAFAGRQGNWWLLALKP